MTKIFLILLFACQLSYGANTPIDESSLDKEIDLFVTKKLGRHHINFKATYIDQEEQSTRKDLWIGHRWGKAQWRVGTALGVVQGLRHNEDWMNNGSMWVWRETQSRSETLGQLFIQHKFFLFPKVIWKNRLSYQRNFFNDQDTMILRSGWLWVDSKNWTLLQQLELFIPLNFNRSTISEFWSYTGMMWRLSKFVSIGPKLTIGKMFWNESLMFKERTGESFDHNLTMIRLGLGAIIRF